MNTMRDIVFGICVTAIMVTLIICVTVYCVHSEEGDRVRNLLKLQENAMPYLAEPSTERMEQL